MISYEEAGRVLDEAVDALPQEIFEGLNGGVNLIRQSRTDEHGLLIMGTYNVNQMGRYVEIYYGSFRIKYPAAEQERCAAELVRTLKHELTHHIESLAMDRSLEKWDEQHVAELLSGLYDEEEPLVISSVLFVDEDGAGLAEMARAMFCFALEQDGVDDIHAGCASMNAGPLSIKAVRAASERYGVSMTAKGPPAGVTRELCESWDVVMCTTLELCDTLRARWPELSERIMCIGQDDFRTPRFDSQNSWNKLADAMALEMTALVNELLEGDGEDD